MQSCLHAVLVATLPVNYDLNGVTHSSCRIILCTETVYVKAQGWHSIVLVSLVGYQFKLMFFDTYPYSIHPSQLAVLMALSEVIMC